jgi:hypothetical protein
MKYLEKYNIFESINLKGKEYGRSIESNNIIPLINRFCKDFNWDDKPIFRGIYNSNEILLSPCMLFNPKAIERKSANTTNYYTMLFDNSPYRGNFPKRSKSLICTSDQFTAASYGEKLYRVIPFDNAKIAICPDMDFWCSFKKIETLDEFNSNLEILYKYFMKQKLNENYNIFIKQLEKFIPIIIKLTEDIWYEKYIDLLKLPWEDVKIFTTLKSIDDYFDLFNPIKNDHELIDYNKYKKSYYSYTDNEIYTDSKALFIDINSEEYYKFKEYM